MIVFTIVSQDIIERRVGMIDIINEILELAGRFSDKGPHLLAVSIQHLHVREVVFELLADTFQSLAQFSERFADVLQVDWNNMSFEIV